MERIRISEKQDHALAGKPPDGSKDWKTFAEKIPIYPSVDREMLYEGDADPFHVTLDIFKIGVTSANGLRYDETLVSTLLEQLPGKGAKMGHTKWSDAGDPTEVGYWIGHVRVGDTIYAKAYIPPSDARETVRGKLASGGKLRTSLEAYGTPIPILDGNGEDTGTYSLADVELEAVDFVRANLAALARHQSGNAIYSRETTDKEQPPMTQPSKITLADVPADVKEQILRESNMTREIEQAKKDAESAKTALTEAQGQIATLQTQITEAQTKITALTTDNQTLSAAIGQYRETEFNALVDAEIAKLTQWHITTETGKAKVTQFRKLVKQSLQAEIGETRDTTVLPAKLTALWEGQFKGLAESLVLSLGGGNAVTQPKQQESTGATQLDALLTQYSGRFAPQNKRG